MGLRQKRRACIGVVGALGAAVCVAGFVGGFLGPGATITIAFAIWAVGAMLVIALTDEGG
ncbi:MAG: hypothetical protein QNJ13_09660 [Paracoccaceae bacterium]|nr:hypothetical protein [Paracoccaceae bacterium]